MTNGSELEIPSAAEAKEKLANARIKLIETATALIIDGISTAIENREGMCSIKMDINEKVCEVLKRLLKDKGYQVDYNYAKKEFVVIWEADK